MSKFKEVHRKTIAVYQSNADAWDSERSQRFPEKHWVERFSALLPKNAEVLDLGCGAGVPVAEYLISRGFELTGADASSSMLALAQKRFPTAEWIELDMRGLSLQKKFDGILAWDSFFHLSQDEQRALLPRLAEHLKQGGALLLTIGHEAGEVLGSVNDAEVYHSSLDEEEYRRILSDLGFQTLTIVLKDTSCGERSVLLAEALQRTC